MMTELKRTS